MLILVISHPVSYGASYSMYFVWEKQTAKPFFINRCVVMVCVWQPFWFWHLLIFHVSSSNASSFPQDNTTTFQTKGFPIDFSRIIALFVYFFWIQPGVPNDNPNDNETITKKSQNPYRPDTGPFARWKPVFLGACCSSKMSKQAQDMAGLRWFPQWVVATWDRRGTIDCRGTRGCARESTARQEEMEWPDAAGDYCATANAEARSTIAWRCWCTLWKYRSTESDRPQEKNNREEKAKTRSKENFAKC